MLWENSYLIFSNIYWILPILVSWFKTLYLPTFILVGVGVFSNLFHLAYNPEYFEYHGIFNVSTSDNVVWNIGPEKIIFVLGDYFFTHVAFCLFAIIIIPKRDNRYSNVFLLLSAILFIIISPFTGIFDHISIFEMDLWIFSVVIVGFLFIIWILFILYHKPDSFYDYFNDNFDILHLKISIALIIAGLIDWVILQRVFGVYYVTHPTWHVCGATSSIFLILSIKDHGMHGSKQSIYKALL